MSKLKHHLIGIAIYTAAVAFVDFVIDNRIEFRFFAITMLLELLVFYTFFALLYFIFLKPKRNFIAAFSILTVGILASLRIFEWYFYLKNGSEISDSNNLPKTLNLYIRFSLYALGYFYFELSLLNQRKTLLSEKNIILTEKKNIESENKILLLQDDKAALENKLRQSDLNFLRAQINPHFLQNCLNFLYSDTRKTNEKAAEAILLLSNIMRYSVADNLATGGMAMLADEITQLTSVIQIHQLRFKEKLHIIFNKEGNFEQKQIPPMILLTLVENLIKYGDLNNNQHPAKIDCVVDKNKMKIYFSTTNKKSYTANTISTGVGLKNIRERLALIWENNFTLEKEETGDWYTVKLCMPYINKPYAA
jgi:two-component system, LytTR family, sensor kinase